MHIYVISFYGEINLDKQLIYSEDGNALYVGDTLTLVDPEKDHGFYHSGIGKIFSDKICDKAILTVKQYKWLEVYFELTLWLGDVELRQIDLEDDEELLSGFKKLDLEDKKDKETHDYYIEPFTEKSDYTFMRYLLSKGAVITHK